MNAVQQVKARQGRPVLICSRGNTELKSQAFRTLEVPDIVDCLQGVLTVIPLQLLSFHLAVLRGYDVCILLPKIFVFFWLSRYPRSQTSFLTYSWISNSFVRERSNPLYVLLPVVSNRHGNHLATYHKKLLISIAWLQYTQYIPQTKKVSLPKKEL